MFTSFKALLIESTNGQVSTRFADLHTADLDEGTVTIKVSHSSVNYKDALAATGLGRIVRRFPCIGGIDLAGTVLESQSSRFKPGDAVLATGYNIGVSHHGGFSQVARLPEAWVVPMPAGLDAVTAMGLGTAGFTAALAIQRMEDNGLRPANGPVAVTGATGGVGSLAVTMLSQLGYEVTAISAKVDQQDYLKRLGAKTVINRHDIDLSKIRSLDTAMWAGVVDNLGGDLLAYLLSTMKLNGTVASVGLAASMNLPTSVAPFILRGVSLLGVDSVNPVEPGRSKIWHRLANDLRPAKLGEFTRVIQFAELPGIFQSFIDAQITGRVVVQID